MALVHLYLALTPLSGRQILPEECLQLGRLHLIGLLVGLVVSSVFGQDLEHHWLGLWLQLLWARLQLLLLKLLWLLLWAIQFDDLSSFHCVAAGTSRQSIVAAPQAVQGSTNIRWSSIFDKVYTGLVPHLLFNGQTLLLQNSCIHLPLQHVDIQCILRRQLLGSERKKISFRGANEDHLLWWGNRLGQLPCCLQLRTLILFRRSAVAEVFRGQWGMRGKDIPAGRQIIVVQLGKGMVEAQKERKYLGGKGG